METYEITSNKALSTLQEYIRENNYKSLLSPIAQDVLSKGLVGVGTVAFAFDSHEKFVIPFQEFREPERRDIVEWLKSYNSLEKKVHTISEKVDFINLKLAALDCCPEQLITLDIETDSTNEVKASIYGLGLCYNPNEAYYIPFKNNRGESWWSLEDELEIRAWVEEEAKTRRWLAHNGIYDTLVIEHQWGIDLAPYLHADTILMKHCVDEERPFGLKETAVKYLGPWADKAQKALMENITKNGGKTTKENMEMFKADTSVLAEYCGFDVILCRMLFDLFEPKLKADGTYDLFYKEEVMPLYRKVTIPMKRKGFPVNVEHFNKLNFQVTQDLHRLEKEFLEEVGPLVQEFCDALLEKDYPVKKSGTFPKVLAEEMKIDLPLTKSGVISLAKKEIERVYTESPNPLYGWLLEKNTLDHEVLHKAQVLWYFKDNPNSTHLFNLKSNNHLKWLFFDKLELEPLSKTDGGEPQVDDDFLESLSKSYPWISKLIEYKKLLKLKSTYIEGILDRQTEGVIYTSMLQFGTTSGRYSSTNPNLQNLPRVKGEDSNLSPLVLKYTNAIREGFVAPKGYKLVDADQSALEPRCFATASSDKNLQAIFLNNEDMYSSIAIRSFKVKGASAFKKDSNFLGKLHPELRQKVKAYCLAVAYGAEANRIAGLLGIEREDAQKLIDDYLSAYPGLKEYIHRCHRSAKTLGMVKTKFGRVRHLPKAKELFDKYGDRLLDPRWAKRQGLSEERYQYKNSLNNSTNMPIQGLAAHIMNRSAIAVMDEIDRLGLDAYVALQIHDQLICISKEENALQVKEIMRKCMENVVKIDVPLIAEPAIADNLKESH